MSLVAALQAVTLQDIKTLSGTEVADKLSVVVRDCYYYYYIILVKMFSNSFSLWQTCACNSTKHIFLCYLEMAIMLNHNIHIHKIYNVKVVGTLSISMLTYLVYLQMAK